MNKKIYFTKFLFLFLLLAISYNLLTKTSFAQSILPLTIAPARQEIRLEAGERNGVVIKFFNLSDAPVSGILKAADFIVDNSDGRPTIIEDSTQSSPRFSGSTWITLPYDRMTIPANDKVTVQANISVPQDAHAGGRYVAIYFEPSTSFPESASGIESANSSVAPRIASLLYIRVNGEIGENAMISRLYTPSFYEYGPIQLDTEILNRGDYHINPRGIITVTNMFGGIVDQASLTRQNIFPDAARAYVTKIGQKWMMGRYKIELAGSYGEKAKSLSQYAYVWVFPWKVVTVIILTIVIIIMLLRQVYKNLVVRESQLEAQIEKERTEIEKLKNQLRKRD